MKAEWISFCFFGITLLIQISLYIVENYFLQKQKIFSFYGLTAESAAAGKDFSSARSWNHLFLAIMIYVGLRYIFKLEVRLAGVVTSFAGAGVILSGVSLLLQSKKFWKVAILEIIPPLLGFFFLLFHIVPSLRS